MLVTLFLSACGGGGGGGAGGENEPEPSPTPTPTPQLLAPALVDVNDLSFVQGQVLNEVLENTGGGELSECVADTLPEGLEIALSTDASSCHLSGEATQVTALSSFTVTASNELAIQRPPCLLMCLN